jgi:hypothetical protein
MSMPKTTKAPPPVHTVRGGGTYVPRIDAKTAASRLGPALFGDKWIPKITLQEEWLVEQGKLDDERTADAVKRQQFMEFQHRKVRDWLAERKITYLHEFEQAFAQDFAAGSPSPAIQLPAEMPKIPLGGSSRAQRRPVHNKIDDDAIVLRMKKALDAEEASSPNSAAFFEAQKLTKQSSGKAVEAVQRRLKGKFKKAFPNG